ncbi:hypothetical protein C1646_755842 [Rhizophagus diaphanus]|nr:hypothetical protein C1646_755842 [Rhizophagus diaphanus] [Rhizophagus sp. MUCL 43196]
MRLRRIIIVFQNGHCEKCGEQYINQSDVSGFAIVYPEIWKDYLIKKELIKAYSMKTSMFSILKTYGISQNPDTKDFMMVLEFAEGDYCEVLRENSYTQAADVYSFGMIMYFAATGKRPFANHAHDEGSVLKICDGIRPEIKEPEALRLYIDLMKRCWDPNADNRAKCF